MKNLLKDIKDIKHKVLTLQEKNRIYDARGIHDDQKLLIESIDELSDKLKNLYLKKLT